MTNKDEIIITRVDKQTKKELVAKAKQEGYEDHEFSVFIRKIYKWFLGAKHE